MTKYNKIVHSIDLRVEENKKLRKEIDGLREEVKYWKEAFETQAVQLAYKNDEIRDLKGAIEYYENEEDDHGRKGFEEYIKWLVKEEEEKFKESWKARLNEELEAIFKEEEETEVKGNGRTSSGRYPWGAKVNDIPCGEDAIE